jgi:hypothetical protein
MPVYYFPINGEKGNKIVSLMANLSENFEVFVDDALRVETKVGFLIPMLEKLQLEAEVLEQDVEPVMVDTMKQLVNETKSIPATPKQRRSAPLPKICKQCGKEFVKGSVGGCCSKRCYNLNYRATHEITVSSRKKGALPNQAKIDQNLNEEQARIEAVVAKAQITAPSADFERHPTGPLMARKL